MKNLKHHSKLFCRALIISLPVLIHQSYAQNVRPRIGVINIDGKIGEYDPAKLGNVARIELVKLDTFDVLDKYDVQDIIKSNNLQTENCYSTDCLSKIGKALNADYMLSGSVDILANNIIVTFKLIDVKKQIGVKSASNTYNNFPLEITSMMSITMKSMFGRPYDPVLFERVTKKFDYENPVSQPNVKQLQLQGPRMGATYLFGDDGKTMQRPLSEGGFGLNPLMFQIGYQFEKQYLNGGNYQALFEFIPMITGIDQSKFMPSLTLMNGLRDNKHGWEFAIGALIAFTQTANTYKGDDGKYYLLSTDSVGNTRSYMRAPKMNSQSPVPTSNVAERFDSGGDTKFMTAIIIAVGKSFRTGNLNVPVNFWVMPQKDAVRIGLSVGFNSMK
ncbi:MAG: hypothetical protein ACHQK8_05735 [Bacteroidia bacterium]